MDKFSTRLKIAMDVRKIKSVELSEKTGIGKSSISQWLAGKYEAKQDKIYLLANALEVDESWLMGLDVPMEKSQTMDIENIYSRLEAPRQRKVYSFAERQLEEQNKIIKISTKKSKEEMYELPIGHESAAGFAILGDDSNLTSTVVRSSEVPASADEIVTIVGDSMEPIIKKGEQVFIHHQPVVENGEIAIVALLDDGITCKRVYFNSENGTITLHSENEEYEDKIVSTEEVRIIGKVLAK